MATVSELSMRQAEALKMQQDVRGQESVLEQAYLRMEQGEAPTEEAARDWERMIRDEKRRLDDAELRRMVRNIHFLLPTPLLLMQPKVHPSLITLSML